MAHLYRSSQGSCESGHICAGLSKSPLLDNAISTNISCAGSFSYVQNKPYVVVSQKNGHNEHPQHKFKLMDKKIITTFLVKLNSTCIYSSYKNEDVTLG